MGILEFRGIVLFIIAFLNLVLAIIFWIGARNDGARFWLGFTALFSALYALFCGGTYFFWNTGEDFSIYWYRSTWIGILLLPCFLLFTYYFTEKTQTIKRGSVIKFIALFLPAIVIVYFSVTTDLFVKSLYLNGVNVSAFAGPLDMLGRAYIVICSIMFFINLLRDYFVSSGLRKQQLRYFILGSGIFTVTGIITTSIVPIIIKESPYYDFAAFASLIWLCLTAYAILKYKLMDVRLIITQLFIFAIWIVVLVKIFLSNSPQDMIINIIIFILIIFFGVLLIRGAIKETNQSEEISKMAEEIRRAYVLEKKAKEELQKIDTFKDHFLTQTQHDLRTPLTAIMGYADMIEHGMFGKQTKKTLDVIKKISLVSKSMKNKADNFLDLAQFQLGKSPVTLKDGVEIFSILDQVKSELIFKAESKGIYLTLEKPERNFIIKADKEKLQSAIFNIVDNAVKYTQKGGVAIVLKNHDTVKIIITDTGIGIAKDKITTMFGAMFERSEEAKKVATGAGVGLYLSAQIIKAHNGKVWAESEGEGKGSTFYIELPLQ